MTRLKESRLKVACVYIGCVKLRATFFERQRRTLSLHYRESYSHACTHIEREDLRARTSSEGGINEVLIFEETHTNTDTGANEE